MSFLPGETLNREYHEGNPMARGSLQKIFKQCLLQNILYIWIKHIIKIVQYLLWKENDALIFNLAFDTMIARMSYNVPAVCEGFSGTKNCG
jgi:hypothetical protein